MISLHYVKAAEVKILFVWTFIFGPCILEIENKVNKVRGLVPVKGQSVTVATCNRWKNKQKENTYYIFFTYP